MKEPFCFPLLASELGITDTNRFFTRRPYTIQDIYRKEEKSGNNVRPFEVCLKFNRETKAQVLDHFQEEEIVNHSDGTIRVTKNYYSINKAIAEIIRFGNKVRILSPKEFILEFMKYLDDTKELYKDYK
ncbi:WYL domain-containing protein [Shouchella tritolerans]|uniref:WYL domain-containing protein n=1 Tax=Shouchella tritolerans TaxID=2979466 RepID=UPI0021E768F2|nr:WYL domain-containing protein [Shouchella tritolerans]